MGEEMRTESGQRSRTWVGVREGRKDSGCVTVRAWSGAGPGPGLLSALIARPQAGCPRQIARLVPPATSASNLARTDPLVSSEHRAIPPPSLCYERVTRRLRSPKHRAHQSHSVFLSPLCATVPQTCSAGSSAVVPMRVPAGAAGAEPSSVRHSLRGGCLRGGRGWEMAPPRPGPVPFCPHSRAGQGCWAGPCSAPPPRSLTETALP